MSATLLIDMLSQDFFTICPYNMADQAHSMPKQRSLVFNSGYNTIAESFSKQKSVVYF